MSRKGSIIIISGPSGSGKGTTIKELLKARKNLRLSISATTRTPRPGEVDAKDYFFISKEEFNKKIENGDMLEYAPYCGNLYGTPKEYIDMCTENGDDIILELEVQGGMQIKGKIPGAVSIFLLPPCKASLEKRLRGRGTEPEKVVLQRLARAEEELKYAQDYDYVVVCGKVDRCVRDILNIIDVGKMKSENMINYIKENF